VKDERGSAKIPRFQMLGQRAKLIGQFNQRYFGVELFGFAGEL